MTWKRRGGRKVIIGPDGGDVWAPTKPRPDETLIRALARAYRWKELLEEGRYRSAGELAEAEGVTHSFVNRLLRLTLLAPDIFEVILEGRHPKGMQLEELTRPLPSDWQEQRRRLSHSRSEPERASNIRRLMGNHCYYMGRKDLPFSQRTFSITGQIFIVVDRPASKIAGSTGVGPVHERRHLDGAEADRDVLAGLVKRVTFHIPRAASGVLRRGDAGPSRPGGGCRPLGRSPGELHSGKWEMNDRAPAR